MGFGRYRVCFWAGSRWVANAILAMMLELLAMGKPKSPQQAAKAKKAASYRLSERRPETLPHT